MFEPIPEPTVSTGYLKINENEKHRIRIMGTSKDPATFVQGWEAWETYTNEEGNPSQRPVRRPYELGKPCPQSLKEIDRDGKPKLFWYFTVWHADQEKPMVYEVTQSTIKDAIMAHKNNPAWGDPSNYVLEISRTGKGMDTTYSVIAEPPSEPPPKDIVNAMKEAMIDLRVIFMKKEDPKANEGNPFGALGLMPATAPSTDDQANIQQIQDTTPPVAAPEKNEEMPANAVGNVALDAITNLKAAQAKSTGAVQDDIPF